MSTITKRIVSIDILRGIVMVIMALDHARDYFTNYQYDPTDLSHPNTAYFFTRWITHYCAPVFVFLAGTSAYLSFNKGKTKKEAARFLFTRGIWLIIMEVTLVRFGWMFNLDYSQVVFQVIWAIGCSMVFLSGLIFLPYNLILTIGLLMIFGHNRLDGIHADMFAENGVFWNIIHQFGFVPIGNDNTLVVIYPIVPWIGVMATGYCFGRIFTKAPTDRDKWLYSIGITAMVLFVVIRYINAYGDLHPWSTQTTGWYTFLSFINCTKYPPSLCYLLMTLGPAITLLPLLEKLQGAASRFFTVFGRVPMFYYLMHIYLLHFMALITGLIVGAPIDYFTSSEKIFGNKPGWGYDLPIVYLYWILAVLILYLPCRWFMYVKMNNKKWWLSYL